MFKTKELCRFLLSDPSALDPEISITPTNIHYILHARFFHLNTRITILLRAQKGPQGAPGVAKLIPSNKILQDFYRDPHPARHLTRHPFSERLTLAVISVGTISSESTAGPSVGAHWDPREPRGVAQGSHE